jgi:hypothetical protein
LNLSGTTSGEKIDGTERYAPVNGGEIFSSRYRCEITAVRFAPAEIPPIMKAFFGSPPNEEIFEATCSVSERE